MRIVALAAVFGLALAGSASAQTPSTTFTLASGVAAPAGAVIVDGVSWRCDASNVCIGSGRGAEQPASRACRRVVARVGAVSAFTWRGVTLSADQLATCNAG